MPSRMINFKHFSQFSSFGQPISEINSVIDGIHNLNNMVDVKETINKKDQAIKRLKTLRRKIISDDKKIFMLLCILFILINSMSFNS